jgi:FkbM family methyltransferase
VLDINKNNDKTKKFAEEFYKKNDFLQSKIKVEEIQKQYPYFGYIKVENYGSEFLIFSNNDDFVAQKYFWLGKNSYESMTLKTWFALTQKAKIIFDIGAYAGLYSLVSATVNTKSRVFAIEALDRNYSRLIINKSVNNLPNIKPFNLAVSDTDGEVNFNVFLGDDILTTGASINEKVNVQNKISSIKKVKSLTLDTFLTINNIPEVNLIKIDVEGVEVQVFKGMTKIFEQFKPSIICEFFFNNDEESFKITELLNKYNYNFYQIDDKNMTLTKMSEIKYFKDMDTLNTLITTKNIDEIELLLKNEN